MKPKIKVFLKNVFHSVGNFGPDACSNRKNFKKHLTQKCGSPKLDFFFRIVVGPLCVQHNSKYLPMKSIPIITLISVLTVNTLIVWHIKIQFDEKIIKEITDTAHNEISTKVKALDKVKVLQVQQ